MSEKELQRTPFYSLEEKAGARFTEFGGWHLPVQYTSIVEEHVNTRQNVSLFDISHMGEILVEGKGAFDFLQHVCVNDLSLLSPGRAQYSPMCYKNGTVVDDMFYYCYSREKYRLVVNASNKDKDVEWLGTHAKKFEGVTVTDISSEKARVALQGPKAKHVLQPLVGEDLDGMARFDFIETPLAGVDVFIARTGYTGEDGFEISFAKDKAETVWNALMETGEEHGIMPAGLGARDTLRLEACYSLYGHEFSERVTPIEAGVEFVVKPSKEADYIGKKVLLDQLTSFIDKKIVALEGLGKGIMRHGNEVFDATGEKTIGEITSGTFSPTFQKPIALAHLDSHYKKIGDQVQVKIRGKLYPAKIVNRPFYLYKPG